MSRRESSESHYNIFNYWKDKCITSNGDVKIEYHYPGSTLIDADLATTEVVVEDWGEPSCWCCNRIFGDLNEVYNDIENSGTKFDDEMFLHKLWNHKRVKSTLQKCHIIPHSLGGKAEPSNLFLLCPSCHLEAPDCENPQFFFKYIYHKRKYGLQEQYEKYTKYLKDIGLYLVFPDKAITKRLDDISLHGGTFKKESLFAHNINEQIKIYNEYCGMTVNEVDKETGYFGWVKNNRDKKAEPYMNIFNKFLQLKSNPIENDISIDEFESMMNGFTDYKVAELISDKYKCNKF